MNTIQNEFLGGTTAIVVETQEQFEQLKNFMGMKNLFLSDGTPAGSMNMMVDAKRVAFYRDVLGTYITYCHPADCDGYKICEFKDAFPEEITEQKVEQRSLFGGDDSPGIKQPDEDLVVDPMEASYTEVENEVSLKEALNQLSIGTIIPAKCDGNLLEFKDKVIEIVNKNENLVITRDNFIESKEVVTDLNAKAKTLKEQRALFNKEVKKWTDPYSTAFSEVINAIENVANKLKSNIKVFEDEEKEELKKKIYETQFNPMLQMLISKEMITEEMSKKFEFNDNWLKKSAFTKSGDFVKKVKDEINAEFERLCKMYESEKKDIETIQSTIKQLSLAHNLDTELNADTYIALYKSGVPMPQVNERINQDITTIKKAVDKQVEKAQEQVRCQEIEQQPTAQKIPEASNLMVLEDEKTGNVLAKGNDHQILATVVQTPEMYQGKIYEYTYTFKGSFGTIKTFSNILKLLSKLFPDFVYERK